MSTAERSRTREEVGQLGKEIQARVELSLRLDGVDKYIVIDVESSDFELDADEFTATMRMRDRRPSSEMWLGRVGWPAAYKIRRGL